MPHLSVIERLRIIKIFQMLKTSRHGNKAKRVQTIARDIYCIEISLVGVYNIFNKWLNSGVIRDFERDNSKKRLISDLGVLAINKQLLKNPFITCLMLKEKLNLVASKRTIRDYINKLGWTKVNTKYCQIVSPINRLKRFIYACCCCLFMPIYLCIISFLNSHRLNDLYLHL
jgi:hypothetical protein